MGIDGCFLFYLEKKEKDMAYVASIISAKPFHRPIYLSRDNKIKNHVFTPPHLISSHLISPHLIPTSKLRT